MALLRFKQTYREAGVELDGAELPDHLCVVLEFGATYDAETAWRLLTTTGPGSSCCGSPWRRLAPPGTC